MRPVHRTSIVSATGAVGAILAALFLPPPASANDLPEAPIVVAAKKPAPTPPEPKSKPAQAAPAKPAAPAVDPAVAALAAASAKAAAGDYLAAQWHPIHFKPAIDKATDADCLVCHAEILKAKPRATSEAGVPANETIAWYQTLDTYEGAQSDFHVRHLTGAFAKQVMNLSCTFCHQGNDPREESPHLVAAAMEKAGSKAPLPFTLRKMVNPTETCLRCHGQFPWQNMEGLTGPWHEIRADMEPEGVANGCLACHETIRTGRHRVNYLKAEAIETAAKDGSDTCYGCHGGRAWYRIPYPYTRTPWPDMPTETPDWAKGRPTAPEARFGLAPQTK